MPETFTQTITSQTVNNDVFAESISVTGNVIERATVSIPAAKVGTLTTRTDNDTGTFTMVTGHGFITSNLIDVFWTSPTPGTRRAMTATVTGDSVVLDGGSGDNLPAAAIAITAMKPVEHPFTVVGNNAVGLGVYSPVAPAWIVFVDSTPADIADATYRINTAGTGKSWILGNGTNPLAGDTTTLVKFSHGDSTAAREMKAAVVRT